MTISIFEWVTLIELPIFIAIFKMLITEKSERQNIKDALAEFKLHVARNYVSTTYLKDIENRLTNHLLRIEQKLDDATKQKM
ncbi:MAG: hypothetical protein R3Y43_02945 [Alphaproteobacteria bacterium]